MRSFFKQQHKRIFGYTPDFKNPQTFNEKMIHRILYDRNPIYTALADKLKARIYIAMKLHNYSLAKAFTIIGGRCGVLLPQTELYSYIPTINLPKDIVSEILIRNDEYKVVDISAKFKDEKGFKFRKLVLSDGKNVYVNNKYYKKFKQFKLYGSDKKTPVIKAYDDNDNLVGFFMPFHPDYFERRYGAAD